MRGRLAESRDLSDCEEVDSDRVLLWIGLSFFMSSLESGCVFLLA
jgi:hypothetical protein